MSDFVVIGCHANRASEASVTLRHRPTGAIVSVHHVPFEHDYGETQTQECDRIQHTAAAIARAAVDFLELNCEGKPVEREEWLTAPTGQAPRR